MDGQPISADLFAPVPGRPDWAYANLTARDLPVSLQIDQVSYFTNTTSLFHLAFGHGDRTGGAMYGYFSGFGLFESALPDTVFVCEGGETELVLDFNVGFYDSVSVAWTPETGLVASEGLSARVVPTETTTYAAIVTTWEREPESGQYIAKCNDADSVVVVLDPAAVGAPPVISGPDSVCAGENYAYTAQDPDGAPVMAAWFADGEAMGRADTLDFTVPNRASVLLSARLELPDSACAVDSATKTLTASRLRARNLLKRDPWNEEQNNGMIAINLHGGFPPYRYRIDDNPYQSDRFFRNLAPGVYLIEATDGSCTLRPEEVIIR